MSKAKQRSSKPEPAWEVTGADAPLPDAAIAAMAALLLDLVENDAEEPKRTERP